MHHSHQESTISGPISLLKHYKFESNGQPYEKVLNSWLERFPLSWVNLALIESLHQGRYKVVSVEQILTLWQRRGKPSYHFTHDFERLVSNNLPQTYKKPSQSQSPRPSAARRGTRWQANSSAQSSQPQESEQAPTSNPSDQSPTATLTPQPDVTKPLLAESLLAQIIPEPEEVSQSDASKYSELEEELSLTTVDNRIEISAPSSLQDTSEQTDLTSSSLESETEDSNSPDSVPVSDSTDESLTPIHQLVPQSATSLFYSKLTAMAQINV